VFALVADAKDEAAARFFRHHGFEAFSGRAAHTPAPGIAALAPSTLASHP
jgi:hypothetical protein